MEKKKRVMIDEGYVVPMTKLKVRDLETGDVVVTSVGLIPSFKTVRVKRTLIHKHKQVYLRSEYVNALYENEELDMDVYILVRRPLRVINDEIQH